MVNKQQFGYKVGKLYLKFKQLQHPTHMIAQASTLVLKIYIYGNPKGTSEGRLRQQGLLRG